MNNFLVLGAGKMGRVLAKNLIDSDEKNQVTLVDIHPEQLKLASDIIRSDRLIAVQKDIEDERQRDKVFAGQNIALCALWHRHSLLLLESSVRHSVHIVDLIGEWPLERLKYNDEAKKKGITLISGLGVSPGITNVCVGRGVHLLDETEKATIYVGGNPVRARPPLNYRIVYAVDSLLGLYERKVQILKGGEVKEVEPLSGIESIAFPAPFSKMECFYTDGLNSLIHTMRGKIKDELAEKTIRHQGHARGIQVLKDCGLFSREHIRVGDQEVVPRQVLEAVLDSEMMLGEERDVTLLRVVIKGKKGGQLITHVFEMVDFFDSEKGFTSMGKTTAFPASIAAQMIVSGQITQHGSLFPENIFHADLFHPFMDALRERGVSITDKVLSDK